jgi:hypothetical protein
MSSEEIEHSREIIMASSIFEISLKFPLEENSFEYLNIKLNGNLNNKEKHFLYHFPSLFRRRTGVVGEREELLCILVTKAIIHQKS